MSNKQNKKLTTFICLSTNSSGEIVKINSAALLIQCFINSFTSTLVYINSIVPRICSIFNEFEKQIVLFLLLFGEVINSLATNIQSYGFRCGKKTYVTNLHYIQVWTKLINTWNKDFTFALFRIDHWSHIIFTREQELFTHETKILPSPFTDWLIG